MSATPDGKYVSTGLAIYSTASRERVKDLPISSNVQAFSKDGTTLYLYDDQKQRIYFITDWEKVLQDPAPADAMPVVQPAPAGVVPQAQPVQPIIFPPGVQNTLPVKP